MQIDNFWDDLEEEEITTTIEPQNNNFDPIPNGTKAVAYIETIQWKADIDTDYINTQWRITSEDFNNRVVFTALRVFGRDPASTYYDADKNDAVILKAKKMLATIGLLCGKDFKKLGRMPNDDELQVLCGTDMMATISEFKGKNFVVGLAPANQRTVEEKPAPAPKRPTQRNAEPKRTSVPVTRAEALDDDDIPF